MRFLKGLVGGLLGAVPGIALIPFLEFFAMVVILLGIIAGVMVGAAPQGRRRAVALRTALGFIAGLALALLPSRFGFLLAPLVVGFAGWSAMRRTDVGPRPTAQP